MTDSVDECTCTGDELALRRFEKGMKRALSEDFIPNGMGRIVVPGPPDVQVLPDGGVFLLPHLLFNDWDYCMGVLAGLKRPHVAGRTVFSSGVTECFLPRLYAHASGNGNTIDVSAGQSSRDLAYDAFERTTNLSDTQTAMWKAVMDDIPPRLKDAAVDIIANMTNANGALDTGFWLLGKNAECVHFEIHRGSLLRLSKDGRHVLACGADALFMPESLLELPEN